jgi:hypothetical protein
MGICKKDVVLSTEPIYLKRIQKVSDRPFLFKCQVKSVLWQLKDAIRFLKRLGRNVTTHAVQKDDSSEN